MSSKSHYPSWDVMSQQEHWDDHTRSIVASRLVHPPPYQYLTWVEAEMLRAICSFLIHDERSDIIQYILTHIDSTLEQNMGEGSRKAGLPDARTLIRQGLKAVDAASSQLYLYRFLEIDRNRQLEIVQLISKNEAPSVKAWDMISQTAFFDKVLKLATESYYSHPTVWSDIGYAGPAYPRGYVRTKANQELEPWEAKTET